MNTETWDLVILGGGCSGISLARELAYAERRGQPIPKTLVLEARATCHTGATWCSWTAVGEENPHFETPSWPAWRFSTSSENIRHSSYKYHYNCVHSRDFFKDALEAIAKSPTITVLTDARAEVFEENKRELYVEAKGNRFSCRYIVDTRPPPRSHSEKSKLFQVFMGMELELGSTQIDPLTVGLMDAMNSDDLGFHFDYVLPLPGNRLLVEATRFSRNPLSRKQLRRDLDFSLNRILARKNYTVKRDEFGIIPMGMPPMPKPRNPNWVFAGTRGGAVRASSGYAFNDIQKWARQCAEKLAHGDRPEKHRGPSPILRAMDRLFLAVLSRNPDKTPELFMQLAKGLHPDQFVRFMTGKARPADLIAVVKSLPAAPFLREIPTGLILSRPSTPRPIAS